MGNTDNREIEANFIHIDAEELKRKLTELGAQDHGEVLLRERIFYPQQNPRRGTGKFVRLRSDGTRILLAYKDRQRATIDGTEEIEFGVDDLERATLFVERLGFFLVRILEKRRHHFTIGPVDIDFDVWPIVKPILQIEGPKSEAVQRVAAQLGLAWEDANFEQPSGFFRHFGVDFESYKVLTFDRLEQYGQE